MLYDINTFVQSIKWDFKTTHWHFCSFVSFYNNKKGLKFTDLELLMIFFKNNFVFYYFSLTAFLYSNPRLTMLFPLVGSTKESKGKKSKSFPFFMLPNICPVMRSLWILFIHLICGLHHHGTIKSHNWNLINDQVTNL